jgi:peptidyl-prolyl cis-trans isomerase D
MLDFFRTHAKKFQWVMFPLLLIGLGFVGIQGFSGFWEASGAVVAKVDGHSITRAEWDAAHQRQVENMRRQMPGMDVKMFDTPEARKSALEQLMLERVVQTAAGKMHLTVGDERLARIFRSDPQFASLRNPDGSVNKDLLATQNMSPEQFEARLRYDLARDQVLRGVSASGLAGAATTSAALDALLQRRELSVVRFEAKSYAAKVNPTDADLQAYHRAHEAEFSAPEQAEIEYVVLGLDALKKDVPVSEDELRKYYTENASRYTVAEERRARHVLVKADKDAAADVKQKARAKAEGLLADLRKNPASFAELARKNSDDPGSAAKGGDLDFFTRGAMVKPFEDAVFAMKVGEISPLVESEFGFHIIQLDAVRGGEKKPFEAVRAEIEDELRKQAASKRYAEAAEQFTNMVYEQSDSLQPVIDKLKLQKQTATVQRTPAPGATGPLASAKLLQSVFTTDVVGNKRNTEAVEVGPNQMAAARIVKHQPARTRPLDEVREQVKARVVASQASALARKDGEARLAQLRKDGSGDLPEKITLSRMTPMALPRETLEALLAADTAKLPVYVGADVGDQGYLVARVDKVLPRDGAGEDAKRMNAQYQQAVANAETRAYLDALKARYKAELRPAAAEAAPADGAGSGAVR